MVGQGVVGYGKKWYGTVRNGTVWFNVRHGTVWYDMVQYGAAHYNGVLQYGSAWHGVVWNGVAGSGWRIKAPRN